MFIQKHWVPISVVLLVVCAVGFFILATQPPPEPIIIYKPVEVEKPPTPRPPPPGASPNGHWHGDEWHDAPHEAQAPPAAPAVENIAPSTPRGKPFANFTPDPHEDPIAAAHKRLDYIANNLHEWGDFSPQTLELMEEMTPVPNIREGDVIPGEGESEIAYLEELSALRDPQKSCWRGNWIAVYQGDL